MTAIDTQALRAAALAATPGKWVWWTSNSFTRLTAERGHDGGVIDGASMGVSISAADAAHVVAAQPATILALLDELDALRAAAKPAKAPKASAYPPEFIAAYDAGRKWRAGSTMPAAFAAWKARIAAKANPAEILAGVVAYAKHCDATGREKMMAQAFFGPKQFYTSDWEVPAPAARGCQPSQKFNFANADRSGDRRAQAETLARHGIAVPDGEVDL